MRKIIISLAMIAAVSAIVVGATGAFFSDQETSKGNTFTAGTIDIAVDGENPWTSSWENYLDKPCQTNYMNFVIENVGENPARIWKRLTNVKNGPGAKDYECNPASVNSSLNNCQTVMVSSEPECQDGTKNYTQCYEERDNLSAFMIYDMAICVLNAQGDNCPLIDGHYENGKIVDEQGKHAKPDLKNSNWKVLIGEDKQVRVDNVVDNWIELTKDMPDGLAPNAKLVVSQSYHLMTWDDAGQPMVTNWAQGDTMTFDVELEARQLTAPAPGVSQNNTATVNLVKKDPTTWDILPGPSGTLTYQVSGDKFVYDLDVTGLTKNTNYCLIYYADPWPGNGPTHTAGRLIQSYSLTTGETEIHDTDRSVELNSDLPDQDDNNYQAGAKVWLVLCSDYNASTAGSQGYLTAWHPDSYLFDDGLVNYDDTDIP